MSPTVADRPRVAPARAPASVPAPAPVEPQSADGLRVSEETYWRDYYLVSDLHYEWNNGVLEEKPVSDYQTYCVYAWFTRLLQHFLDAHPIARMVALEMGFRLPLPSGTVIRKPDLGVVRTDNPQPLLPLDVSYHGVFDLCIEALSDQERRGIVRDAVTKKAERGPRPSHSHAGRPSGSSRPRHAHAWRRSRAPQRSVSVPRPSANAPTPRRRPAARSRRRWRNCGTNWRGGRPDPDHDPAGGSSCRDAAGADLKPPS